METWPKGGAFNKHALNWATALHVTATADHCHVQAKRHGLPGGEEEKEALEDAAAPTDIPRLFAPGRLLYLSQHGEVKPTGAAE